MSREATLEKLLEQANAVIFDFDNIIVDSEPYHYRAYEQVFAAKGHTLNREEYWLEWTSKGGGAEKEIERFGLDLDPAAIRREKDPIYAEYCRSGAIEPFPEALGIIQSLHGSGYLLAIASGSYERDIRAILSARGIEPLFTTVVGKDGVARYKPHPETYQRASEHLGMAPEFCLAIEDAEKGIKSARDAGMKVVLIETPLTRGFDLQGADLSLSGLEEFSRLLGRILPKLKR